MIIVGDFINSHGNAGKDDLEEQLAKDLFKDIFSQFNTKKENKKFTTVCIHNNHDFAWGVALNN